ncbi:MAG: type I-U CRISPR-associated protein Csb2 [Gammaproteobacteria bacterium]|nr:type I-U CRISPR-associated protein Csb2 [Gammaproteobacteria bacterium]
MPRSLLIAVRFHEGRYHGQGDRVGGEDGWPPSPGRLFQALVAGAARGATFRPEDRRALEWLERLDPPRIAAPAIRRGRAVRRFVPNNDLDSVGGDPARVGEIRVGKQWRPWFFDPEVPVLYVWSIESEAGQAMQVCSIATRLYQLGRGIDMAWASGQVMDEDEAEAALASHPGVLRTPSGKGATATPHPGTLDSLAQRYQRKRDRLTTVIESRKARQLFTQPPKASFANTGYDAPARCLHFELRTAEHNFAPQALASAAPLLLAFRDAAARRLANSIPEKAELFERLIVGRGAGPQDLAQRIRLVPVPSIGTEHTDPSIRRIMVEIPANCPLRLDDLKWAFAGLPACDPQTGESWSGHLVSTDDARMAKRFAGPARAFKSITPLALPGVSRHRQVLQDQKLGSQRDHEERHTAGLVVRALRHAGIRATPADIRVQREPFQRRGTRAKHFAAGSRFSKHALWHVHIRFRELVPGPMVVGDGRFCGLGLMEPVTSGTSYSDVFAFRLDGRRPITAEDRTPLLRHLRRALMALARNETGGVDRLFSGHERDGRPDAARHHAHVFVAADRDAAEEGSITRLVVAAPWAVDRSSKRPPDNQRRFFDEVVRRLTELTAGRLGRFDGLVAEAVQEGDPLLGPSILWTGTARYIATRNLKKRDEAAAFVKEDVIAECRRRSLPAPTDVEVLDVGAGPRGGRPEAMLKLRFATAVRGPVLLGRDSHSGGGLFHAGP